MKYCIQILLCMHLVNINNNQNFRSDRARDRKSNYRNKAGYAI